MEYDFYVQWFRVWRQLDPSWLSLKEANNLPIVVEGVTWVMMQVFNQVVERVGVVDTCSSVVSFVPIVLGMNVLKDLHLSQMTERERLCGHIKGCDHQAV